MRWLVALVLISGCKDKHAGPPPAPVAPADAAVADANLDSCRASLAKIASLPAMARPQALLDACQPCGDWSSLLAWNTPATAGGPSHASIEAAMAACHGYCDGNARQRFLGTLDDARGQATRGPWRYLGETCKAAVSAEPDARYMSAPFFALDRIARALGDGGPALTVPLPAVSVTGVGVELPAAAQDLPVDGEVETVALTVDANSVLVGRLPSAALSSHGLVITADYPGQVVPLARLAAQLKGAPALILAPHALPAARIADVIAAAHGGPVRIAVGAPSPRGWSLPGALPLRLTVASANGAQPAVRGVATVALAAGDKVDDLVAHLTAAIAPGITGAAILR